jgi:glycosyltransferase involved in cell wall biosynthesis
MVAHAYPPTIGGVESHVWDVSHRLARRRIEVFCLVGGKESEHETQGVRVRRTPALSVELLLKTREALRSDSVCARLSADLERVFRDVLAEIHPDLVHAHNLHHFAPEPALQLFKASDSLPCVNGIHDHVGQHVYPGVLDLPWSMLLFASDYLFQSLGSHGRPSRVVHLGIDWRAFARCRVRDLRVASYERPVIVHPARLLRWKGPHVSIAAFTMLRSAIGSGTLVLCGSDNTVEDRAKQALLRDELETLAANCDVAPHVAFEAFGREDMARVYRAADLVWYPTVDEEPYGLVPLEAMASGVPVVVSASGGMLETVEHGVSGLIVPKGDAAALAAASASILTDPDLRGTLIMSGQSRAKHFDCDKYVDQLLVAYEEAAT